MAAGRFRPPGDIEKTPPFYHPEILTPSVLHGMFLMVGPGPMAADTPALVDLTYLPSRAL